jgi:staphyloferrin B biosynthesis citrate synthase
MTTGSFRERMQRRELLLGTFIKTPSSHTTEVLAGTGLHFGIIDQEHGPFDRVTTDQALMGARGSNFPALVRVPTLEASAILAALDDGAAGVLVPHVSSAELATAVVRAARYGGGRRGFSNTTRAGGYGHLGVWDHVHAADAATVVLAAIEDPEALDSLDAIGAVEGLDGFFIGRGDLTVALGAESPQSPSVRAAAERIAAAGLKHGKTVCAHVGSMNPDEVDWLRGIGVSVFVIASDQGLLRHAAREALAEFGVLTADPVR